MLAVTRHCNWHVGCEQALQQTCWLWIGTFVLHFGVLTMDRFETRICVSDRFYQQRTILHQWPYFIRETFSKSMMWPGGLVAVQLCIRMSSVSFEFNHCSQVCCVEQGKYGITVIWYWSTTRGCWASPHKCSWLYLVATIWYCTDHDEDSSLF